ncbi:MAG: GGDEF domain-containing protein [Burkholderiales bacterium]|nr:GGDEF domain-containing protein [Burkholderiales bacterium]
MPYQIPSSDVVTNATNATNAAHAGRAGGERAAWLVAAKRLILSDDPKQRRYILSYLIGVANCVAGAVALNMGVSRGAIDASAGRWLTVTALLVSLGLYIVLRSGLNKRFQDPGMTGVQMKTGVVYLAWGYYIGGPGRTVALMLLFLILMFGMFVSSPRQLKIACLMSAVLFGISISAVAVQERDVLNMLHLHIVYYGVTLGILASLVYMGGEQARLRARLMRQKNELAAALKHIQELASHDDLTGLINRRQMNHLLATEQHRALRTGRPFSVCMLDVDHFKRINDGHGHGVGDEVLQSLAQVVQAELRDIDVLARWGGEEFVILFPDTAAQDAFSVVERVRGHLASIMVCSTHPDLRITASAGVSDYRADESLSALLDRADQALYQAKNQGRNRTIILA